MEQEIKYTIRKSKRAKRMRITIHNNGSVVLTLPFGVSEQLGQEFINKNRTRLLKKITLLNSIDKSKIIKLKDTDYKKNKEEALRIINKRLESLNEIYGYKYNRVSIKNQKTRWGSCSQKKNLNFNYRLIFLPEYLRDYVIVHELCHLKELNHSNKFWDLVSKSVPDYKRARRELRRFSLYLQ